MVMNECGRFLSCVHAALERIMSFMNDTPDDKPAGETDKQPSVDVSRETLQPHTNESSANGSPAHKGANNRGNEVRAKKRKAPQRPKKSKQAPKHAQRQAQKQAQKQAMSQQTLGYIIFGLGVLAFLGVGVFAYQTYMGPSSEPEIQQQASASVSGQVVRQQQIPHNRDSGKSNQNNGTSFADLRAPLEQSQQALPTKDSIKHKKNIRKRHISGNWSAPLREAKARLWVDNTNYQLIIDFDYPALASRYSQGTYVLSDGMMLLQPRPEWGKPQNISTQSDKEYNLLTRNEFSVLLSQKDNALYWIEPQSTKKHRFFAYRPEGLVQWTKIR